jgi:hypothetical protein
MSRQLGNRLKRFPPSLAQFTWLKPGVVARVMSRSRAGQKVVEKALSGALYTTAKVSSLDFNTPLCAFAYRAGPGTDLLSGR